MPRRRRQKHGFTLLEVAVSIYLLGMGFLVTMSTLLLSQSFTRQGVARAAAYGIARQQMEQVVAQSAGSLALVNNRAFTIPAQVVNSFPAGANGIDIQGTYSISTANASGSLKKVEVHVRWRNAASTNISTAPYSDVSLVTIVADS